MPISTYIKNLRTRIGTETIFMPAVMAIVFNRAGEVLIGRDRGTGTWHAIGGALEPGEEPAACAVREVKEETGIDVTVEQLVGVYAGPFIRYANADQVHYVTIAIKCRAIDDSQRPRVSDDELSEVRFCPIDQLPESISDYVKARIARAAESHTEAELLR